MHVIPSFRLFLPPLHRDATAGSLPTCSTCSPAGGFTVTDENGDPSPYPPGSLPPTGTVDPWRSHNRSRVQRGCVMTWATRYDGGGYPYPRGGGTPSTDGGRCTKVTPKLYQKCTNIAPTPQRVTLSRSQGVPLFRKARGRGAIYLPEFFPVDKPPLPALPCAKTFKDGPLDTDRVGDAKRESALPQIALLNLNRDLDGKAIAGSHKSRKG